MADSLPGMDTREDTEDTNYVLVMDNYFTLSRAIGERGLRGKGVGVVGTARARPGWPCSEFKNVTDACFNSLYYCDDEEGFRIFRWVDNNIVTMVSSIHTGEEKILRKRKRPQKNATNKNHLPQIFGDEAVAEIEIPGVVDDYN